MEWIGNLYNNQPTFISWLISLVGLFLLLLPTYLTWHYSKKHINSWKFTTSFIVFGALVIPLSFFLYFQFYLGPIRALIFGFVGLLMLTFHIDPFEVVSTHFLLTATDTKSGTFGYGITSHLLTGGAIWALLYGFVGFIIDIIIRFIKPSNKALNQTGANNAPPG